MNSILETIKQLLGSGEDHFDQDIIIGINTALSNLNQLGVGPAEGLYITDNTTEWSELIGERKDLEFVKSYVHLKTKLLFDPPSNSFLIESINSELLKLEWRINSQVETTITGG